MIRCGDKTLAQGEINLPDLSTPEKSTFKKDIKITGIDLTNRELMWNFRGEIFDSKLNQKIEIMRRDGTDFDDKIEGIGFHITIDESGQSKTDKIVYKNKALIQELIMWNSTSLTSL
jgi:hypothetical protein